jgi:glutathione S-transferase
VHDKLTLYGWHLSYFTGKVLCYLRYKQILFVDQPVSLLTLVWRIKRKTGAAVMPVLRTPAGEWIQDSSIIMDRMEAVYPKRPVVPPTPVQRFASSLMEAWGDEWWIPMAMYTRWTHPENDALFEKEAGNSLLPHFPAFVQRRAAAYVASTLRGYLPSVGVRPEQYALMDGWMARMLDLLDAHFAQQPYLFGDRPGVGDFGLVGSMYGHLGRDPWPARQLIAPRLHLRAWIDRMAHPVDTASHGQWLAGDHIAPTLAAIFRILFKEFLPMLEGINRQVKAALPGLVPGKALPRGLDDVEMPMGEGRFRRLAMPYTLWMAQRTQDVYRTMNEQEQAQVRDWLVSVGGSHFLELDIPRLRRSGLRVVPE